MEGVRHILDIIRSAVANYVARFEAASLLIWLRKQWLGQSEEVIKVGRVRWAVKTRQFRFPSETYLLSGSPPAILMSS